MNSFFLYFDIMIRKIILISVFNWALLLNAQNTYVATLSMGGDDTNAGTLTSPFATVNKALSVMGSGDTCFIRTGSYSEEVILDGKNNIVIMPYMNEWVVFDGTMNLFKVVGLFIQEIFIKQYLK